MHVFRHPVSFPREAFDFLAPEIYKLHIIALQGLFVYLAGVYTVQQDGFYLISVQVYGLDNEGSNLLMINGVKTIFTKHEDPDNSRLYKTTVTLFASQSMPFHLLSLSPCFLLRNSQSRRCYFISHDNEMQLYRNSCITMSKNPGRL